MSVRYAALAPRSLSAIDPHREKREIAVEIDSFCLFLMDQAENAKNASGIGCQRV